MDTKYYTVIIFMSVFGLAIMDVVIFGSSFIKKELKRTFLVIYTLAMTDALAEWAGVMLNGMTELRGLHMAVKCFELCTAPLIPLLCSEVMGVRNKTKLRYALAAFYGIHILMEIISVKAGFIFYMDADSVYRHGDMYFLYYISFVPGLILMMREAFAANKEYQGQNSHIMILSVILLLGGLVVQGVDSSLKTDWVSATVFGFLFFIYYSDLMQKIDNTTTLLDRLCYDDYTSRLRRKAIIVLLDVDKFKQINDNYGHLYGDEVLNIIGRTAKDVFSKYGHCFRIGGDEMCAILVRKPKELDELCASVNERLDRLRERNENLPTVSVGYAELTPKENFSDAFARADEMMYTIKKSAAKARE